MHKQARSALIAVSIFFLLLTLYQNYLDTHYYGAADLRYRIVGARLFPEQLSPYFYHWSPKDDPKFTLPPTEPGRIVNGNVVTPATLIFLYPLATLDYPLIKWLWVLLQYLAATAILMMIFRTGSVFHRFLMALPIVLGLICSKIWIINIEAGQIYIFYSFLLALSYRLYTSDRKASGFLSGLVIGFLILFRPFAAVIGLPFLIRKKFKWLTGCAAGLALGCILLVMPFKNLWIDYFRAMEQYVIEEKTGYLYTGKKDIVYPEIIENSKITLIYRGFEGTPLPTVYQWFKRFGTGLEHTQTIPMLALGLLIFSVCFLKFNRNPAAEAIFIFGFLGMMMAELSSITTRSLYNVIQWIFPLALILNDRKNYRSLFILGCTGLLLLHKIPFEFEMQDWLAEFFFIGIAIYYCLVKKTTANIGEKITEPSDN